MVWTGDLVIQFGRVDYVLIIGLRFGMVSKKLIKVNHSPEDRNSVYSQFIHHIKNSIRPLMSCTVK